MNENNIKTIFVTGQCTVHWGRLEYGNVGNYYITEVMFRELGRVFPNAEIYTTFQMTDDFVKRIGVNVVPMELFYNWDGNDLDNALAEYDIALNYNKNKSLINTTQYIEQVMSSDIVFDFSGELWGDHAELVGEHRFQVGLLKMRTAQLLGVKTVLLAGSQGPFTNEKVRGFAKEVFENFSYIANRESKSIELLKNEGFNVSNVKNFTDPAFIFEPTPISKISRILENEELNNPKELKVGFILCGFNMSSAPYDKWPRNDEEFLPFVEAIEYIVGSLGAKVYTFSHQNGFELPPDFKLINGRDYPYAKRLKELIDERNIIDLSMVKCIENPYLPKDLKSIISVFDMLVTGRIHGFVAGVSQFVPSVVINRGNGPVSLRNQGFAKSVDLEYLMANPYEDSDLINKIKECWSTREIINKNLKIKVPKVQQIAHDLFNSLASIE